MSNSTLDDNTRNIRLKVISERGDVVEVFVSDNIQTFTFGSDLLEYFHLKLRSSNGMYIQNAKYIVNHGRFRTLNEVISGQVVPNIMEIIEA